MEPLDRRVCPGLFTLKALEWPVAVLVLGALDVLMTWWGLGNGAVELNPLGFAPIPKVASLCMIFSLWLFVIGVAPKFARSQWDKNFLSGISLIFKGVTLIEFLVFVNNLIIVIELLL